MLQSRRNDLEKELYRLPPRYAPPHVDGNAHKTKYMCMKWKNDVVRQNLTIDNYNFEGVKEFIYLGSLIQNYGSLTPGLYSIKLQVPIIFSAAVV